MAKQNVNIMGRNRLSDEILKKLMVTENDKEEYLESFPVTVTSAVEYINSKICVFHDNQGNKCNVTKEQVTAWCKERKFDKYTRFVKIVSFQDEKDNIRIPLGQVKKCADVLCEYINDIKQCKTHLFKSSNYKKRDRADYQWIRRKLESLEKEISDKLELLFKCIHDIKIQVDQNIQNNQNQQKIDFNKN